MTFILSSAEEEQTTSTVGLHLTNSGSSPHHTYSPNLRLFWREETAAAAAQNRQQGAHAKTGPAALAA